MGKIDEQLAEECAGERLALLLASYARLTGKPLARDAAELWAAPAAVVAHDTRPDPQFIYANACALALFGMGASQFLGMPSRKSAEPMHRDERAAMLARLDTDDIVTGYSGVRIAADGTRFRIVDTVIWNLRDAGGALHGQAAWFEDLEMLY